MNCILGNNLLLLFSHSVVSQLFATPWTAVWQTSLSFTASWSLLTTYIHCVNDAIQPSHPLSHLSPLALNLSQHQVLFQCVSSSHQVGQSIGASASASVLPVNIQDRFPLGLTGLISSQSKGLSRVFYSTTVQKHQFFGSPPSLYSNSHFHT